MTDIIGLHRRPESCSAGTQTSVILADDKATEPVEKKHVEVQTDDAADVQLNVNEQPFDKQVMFCKSF